MAMTSAEATHEMMRIQATACCPLWAMEVCRKCKPKQARWQAAKVWQRRAEENESNSGTGPQAPGDDRGNDGQE